MRSLRWEPRNSTLCCNCGIRRQDIGVTQGGGRTSIWQLTGVAQLLLLRGKNADNGRPSICLFLTAVHENRGAKNEESGRPEFCVQKVHPKRCRSLGTPMACCLMFGRMLFGPRSEATGPLTLRWPFKRHLIACAPPRGDDSSKLETHMLLLDAIFRTK